MSAPLSSSPHPLVQSARPNSDLNGMTLHRTVSKSACQTAGPSETIYTGDILHGIQVITHLSLSDVPPNAVTRYYLRTSSVNSGLDIHLPVWVARGPASTLETGKKLSLSSGVHGDEQNGVRVVQRILEELEAGDCSKLNGTVIGIPAINPPGLYLRQREYFTSGQLDEGNNLNMVFPGKDPELGASGPSGLAHRVWNGVWGNGSNVDVHIDLHTAISDMDGLLFAYANYIVPGTQRVAELAEPDVILASRVLGDSSDASGTIQGTFSQHGIPSITLELCNGNEWHKPTIQRGVDYIHRLMIDMGIRSSGQDTVSPYKPDLSKTLVAKVSHAVPARYGGWVETLVAPGQRVQSGQVLGKVLNGWGDVLEEVTAPVEGLVLLTPRNPGMESGRPVAVLVYEDIEGVDTGEGIEFSSRFPYTK